MFDNKHPSKLRHKTKPTYAFQSQSFPPSPPLSSYFLSSLPLVSRSRITLTDTKPPPRGSRTPSFLAHFSLSFVYLHVYRTPPACRGGHHVHCVQSRVSTSSSISLCALPLSLGDRLGGTAVHIVSTDLSRSCFSRASTNLLNFCDGHWTRNIGKVAP